MGALALGLRHAERVLHRSGNATTTLRRDGFTQTPVAYADFEIDDERLHTQLENWWGGPLDVVTELRDDEPRWAIESLERLLGDREGDLPDGRASLYVCPECMGLGCGAITARVEFTRDTVVWRDLGWQTDYEPDIEFIPTTGERLSLEFARPQYEYVLKAERARYEALRAEAAAIHRQEQNAHRSGRRARFARVLRRR